MAHKLPPHVVDTLLDKLSSDDDFRDLFQRDPGEALETLGYAPNTDAVMGFTEDVKPASAGPCLSVDKLASKEAIAAARARLRIELMAPLSNHVHILNAD